ncbi:egl nine homolog 1 [Galleria mellonella]|uniref:hypoxia-inducible factor-proline dioxygenase n=1 Tax=Galleria mellonella TaxID=7137 RepID=A0A6J1WWS4_GALME|nr:egl nine homolog 1 [Galleria mellonella]
MNQERVESQRCAICNQQTSKRCTRCLSVYYCNKEHQRQDWKRHKSECKLEESKKGSKIVKAGEHSIKNEESVKNRVEISFQTIEDSSVKEVPKGSSANEIRRSKRSKKKNVKEVGKERDTASVDKHSSQISTENVKSESGASEPSGHEDSSVIFSVVYVAKDLSKGRAITYEGSSEQEILSESDQQLSTLDFSGPSSSNVLRTVNRGDDIMPVSPSYSTEDGAKMSVYQEASLKGSGAPFFYTPSSYDMDLGDDRFSVCHRLISDMTQYGVCVLDNFLGKEKGLFVLDEVIKMHQSGIFRAGQVVSNPGTDAQTIRSDQTTWIDGKEPHCYYINYLISQVDNIVLRANKMPGNGKMGDFTINGRTKAMVACYPGSGSHYVKHVDNPNKDGRCITAIYYLNRNWDVNRCGGLLRVFPEGTNQVADIAPIFDRMLFFWSDRRNPHEVQPAYQTRYAITLWYFDSQEREEAQRRFKNNAVPSSSE